MRWIRNYNTYEKPHTEYKRALIVTLGGNILLGVLKAIAAYISNSMAVYADAVNSLSDIVYSILLVIGLWMALRPPDRSHPQGHSRFEPIAALIVSISMAYAGFEAGRSSIVRFLEGGGEINAGFPLVILIVSIGIKILMYLFIRSVAKKTRSPGLEAAAGDNITDVVTSIAAGIGILAAQFINPIFDPIAGILVAIWIFRAVIQLARENLGYLTGAGASKEMTGKLLASVRELNGVENIHHIITEYAGPKLVVDIHINVDGKMTLNQAHAICDLAIEALTSFPEVDRAYVHVEPIGYR